MIPSATYRIQFRNGMTFDRVVELVPYMKDLGISPSLCLTCVYRHDWLYARL